MQNYIQQAIRTESKPESIQVNEKYILESLKTLADIGENLDKVKKIVFYNSKKYGNFKENVYDLDTPKTVSDENYIRVFHSLLGLITESAELAEILIKMIENDEYDSVHISEEIGDLYWYIALVLDTIKVSENSVKEANIAKLKARYPEKFTEQNASERNIETEYTEMKKFIS